jgi:hypothetical protein
MVTSDDLDFDDDFLKNSSFNEGVLEWELTTSDTTNGEECELDLLLDDELDLDLDDELDLLLDDELDLLLDDELDLLLDDELDLLLDDELDLDLDLDLDDEESFPPRNESPFSSNEIENE